jgi:hypothetical protein
MGNQAEKNKKFTDREKFAQTFSVQYKLVKEYDDIRFSEISLYKHKVDLDHIIVKHKWLKTEAEYMDYL